MVASLPRSGARPEIWVARAARTCWDESVARSRTHMRIRDRMTSRSMSLQKPAHQVANQHQVLHSGPASR